MNSRSEDRQGNLELIGTSTKPAKPGIVPGDITNHNSTSRSPVPEAGVHREPEDLHGSQPFSLTITN